MWTKKVNNFLPAVFLFCSIFGFAQPSSQTFNPYSRYGIGELENKGFAQLSALGRATTAFDNDDRDSINPVFLNPANPASYSSLRLTSFEVGGKGDFSFFESSNNKSYRNNAYLSYISLGFPLGRKAGFAAGLSPFSAIGYSIYDVNTDPSIDGDITTLYEGSGGMNQVFAGIGYRPFQNMLPRFLKSKRYDSLRRAGSWDVIRKKRFVRSMLSSFSLGANGYLLFGDLNNTASVIYPANGNFFNVRRVRETRVNDFYSSFGAMLSFRIDSTGRRRACIETDTTAKEGVRIVYRKECGCRDTMKREEYERLFPKKLRNRGEWKITLGGTVYLPTEVGAEYNALGFTYKQFGTIMFPYDTTLRATKTGGITMPLITTFGIALRKSTKLAIFSDVSIQNWSYYRFFGEDPGLKNSMRYSLGMQYVNNGTWKSRREMFKEKTMYRAGLFYNTGNLDLKKTMITEYGVSLGVGLPLGNYSWHTLYHANIAVELGTLGTTQNNLVKNNFIRATIGLTLNQKWFVKRVID